MSEEEASNLRRQSERIQKQTRSTELEEAMKMLEEIKDRVERIERNLEIEHNWGRDDIFEQNPNKPNRK